MGIYQQKLWFNGNLPAKMVIQWEFTSKNGDSSVNLPAKWEFTSKNGDLDCVNLPANGDQWVI